MGIDLKLQVYRGDIETSDVDFRASTGNLRGAPEDHHRTVLETRVTDEDLESIGVTLEETFDAIRIVNRVFNAKLPKQDPRVGEVASALGLEGEGDVKVAFRVFDED